MKGDPALRKLLGELVSTKNEKNWSESERFEKNTRQLLPQGIMVLHAPPEENKNYNCFVYALGLQNHSSLLGNKAWKFTRELGGTFEDLMKNGLLRRTESPETGDLVVYRGRDGIIGHVGIFDQDNMVVSKWSWGPLLRHAIFDVPDHYGDEVSFYRIAEAARSFVLAQQKTNRSP